MLCSFLLLSYIHTTVGDCTFTQDSPDDNGNCPGSYPSPDGSRCAPRPVNKSAGEDIPHIYTGAIPNQCPMYDEVCCSDTQMMDLLGSFAGIYGTFGDVSEGGCPGCYQNVVDFWCQYTCSPLQTQIVGLENPPFVNKTDPESGDLVTVINTVLHIDAQYACGVFDSCETTGRVKQFSPMQTCEGFFTYQGQVEAIGSGLSYIDFVYNKYNKDIVNSAELREDQAFLSSPLYSCCNFPANINGGPASFNSSGNTSCPCSSCAAMCAGGSCTGSGQSNHDLGNSPKDSLKGFSAIITGAWIGGLLGLSIFASFIKQNLMNVEGGVPLFQIFSQEGKAPVECRGRDSPLGLQLEKVSRPSIQ